MTPLVSSITANRAAAGKLPREVKAANYAACIIRFMQDEKDKDIYIYLVGGEQLASWVISDFYIN